MTSVAPKRTYPPKPIAAVAAASPAAVVAAVSPAVHRPSGTAGAGAALPRRWTETILPAELPSIARQIVLDLRAEIPEYRRAMDGPYGRSTRKTVEQALIGFVTQVVTGEGFTVEHDEFFRSLGRTEALEGRTHDVLQTAYRIGSMTAWRRIMALNERAPLPADTVAQLAASLFGFIDHLASRSAEGFREAQLARSDQGARLRARLLQLLLDQPATPLDAILDLAGQIGWRLPERVAVLDVAVPEGAARGYDPLALFGPDALVGLEQPAPTVLVPILAGRECDWTALLPPASRLRLSVGCPVPLSQARLSLQSAQLLSRLRIAGTLPSTPVLVGDAHVPLLLVEANPVYAAVVVARRLGPLLALTPAKRLKFARLLSAWLERGGSMAETAEALAMHRQTAHYQFARLSEMFGPALRDRDARVEMILALRAVLPEWERAA